ncbi:MAG: hypothetical protein JNM63_14320 [Spirochaetia bacterium]|nr:hypothetical protein [Spirochaetia bacterium]
MKNFLSLSLLLTILILLASCSPAIEVTNGTSKQIYITFDKGAENILASGQKLRKEFNGSPDVDIVMKGSGNYLKDFSTNIHLIHGEPLSLDLKADVGRLRLVNSTGGKISAYYISARTNAGWGTSQGTLDASSETTFRVPAGSWDLWVVTATGTNLYKTFISVALEAETTITISAGGFTASAPANKVF